MDAATGSQLTRGARRLVVVGAVMWLVGAILPGVLSAARGPTTPAGQSMAATLSEIYTPEVAAFLRSCPLPLLGYLIPSQIVSSRSATSALLSEGSG